MLSRETFELDGREFKVRYRYEKKLVWAIAFVDGMKIETYGTDEETAFWAIKQKVYQHLNVRF